MIRPYGPPSPAPAAPGGSGRENVGWNVHSLCNIQASRRVYIWKRGRRWRCAFGAARSQDAVFPAGKIKARHETFRPKSFSAVLTAGFCCDGYHKTRSGNPFSIAGSRYSVRETNQIWWIKCAKQTQLCRSTRSRRTKYAKQTQIRSVGRWTQRAVVQTNPIPTAAPIRRSAFPGSIARNNANSARLGQSPDGPTARNKPSSGELHKQTQFLARCRSGDWHPRGRSCETKPNLGSLEYLENSGMGLQPMDHRQDADATVRPAAADIGPSGYCSLPVRSVN
jgi:hypothetical protein